MSSSDKTGQKLVDSMRKSRSTAGESPSPADKPVSGGRKAPAPKAKAPAPKTKAPAPKAKAPRAKVAKPRPARGARTSGQGDADPYQAAPRVWPD
jgi:hypothetical protein